jgi:tetratricopeptide (TPR) repeat protein
VPILNKYVDSNKESFFELAIRIIGYPTIGGEGITVTQGIISGFDEDKNLKTDSEVNHGNSGGGAFDENNNFIGIPSFLISSDSGKISFIIPVYKIRDWFNNVLNYTVTPKMEMSLAVFNEKNLNYSENLSTEPQNPRIISKFALIESLLKEQKYLEIPEQIEYILNERPYSSLAYQYLGDAYLGLNMYSEASEAYQASIELNPYKISTLGNYAIVLSNLKKYEEAIQINEQIILIADQELYKALAYNNLGEIYYLLGDYNLAVENFIQALGRCLKECSYNEMIRENLRNATEKRSYNQ